MCNDNEFEHLRTNEWQALTVVTLALAVVALMVMDVATVVPCLDGGGCRGGGGEE